MISFNEIMDFNEWEKMSLLYLWNDYYCLLWKNECKIIEVKTK